MSRHEFVLAEREMHLRDLREANENLTLALLASQELDEQAAKACSRQVRFLSMVAEDLRKPLQPIRTAADLLGRAQHDEALRARLPAIIKRQVHRMMRLVDDLMAFAQPGDADAMFELGRIDLLVVLAKVAELAGRALDAKCQRLVTTWPAAPPPLRGRAGQLIRIVTRLLDNASRHSPEGSEIRLTVDTLDADVRIIVSDDGAGIAADALASVFAPDASRTRAPWHHDMAMHILRDMVEAEGGNIRATSAGRGLGSQFTISFPQEDDQLGPAPG